MAPNCTSMERELLGICKHSMLKLGEDLRDYIVRVHKDDDNDVDDVYLIMAKAALELSPNMLCEPGIGVETDSLDVESAPTTSVEQDTATPEQCLRSRNESSSEPSKPITRSNDINGDGEVDIKPDLNLLQYQEDPHPMPVHSASPQDPVPIAGVSDERASSKHRWCSSACESLPPITSSNDRLQNSSTDPPSSSPVPTCLSHQRPTTITVARSGKNLPWWAQPTKNTGADRGQPAVKRKYLKIMVRGQDHTLELDQSARIVENTGGDSRVVPVPPPSKMCLLCSFASRDSEVMLKHIRAVHGERFAECFTVESQPKETGSSQGGKKRKTVMAGLSQPL